MKALCRDCFWTGGAAVRRCPSCGSPRILAHAELDSLSMAHLDCDAFYASVEKRDRPELRDEALIVGGGKRGVVTTCCYIARMSGVRSAMPMFQARKLCPQAVIIPPDFPKYRAASKDIFGRVALLTPLVQPLSLDEAWIDLSGTERLHGAPPALTLARLQAEIEAQVGLTVSIGLAANKFLAKIASDLDKPRGFSVLGAEARAFLASRPVSILPGVGPAFVKTLNAAGFRTVGDIAGADVKELADRFGSGGLRLSRLAQGQDSRAVDPEQVRKTISAETTFFDDLSDQGALEDQLWPLCERVAKQARAGAVAGRVATLKLRATDFKIITRRRTLAVPIQTARTLFAVCRELLAVETRGGKPWRLIGAGLTDFIDDTEAGADFFAEEERRTLTSEKAIDKLRAKFGADAVMSGRALKGGDG